MRDTAPSSLSDQNLHMTAASPEELAHAERRVARQVGFFHHFGIYLAVNTGLILLNLMGQHRHWWSLGPLLGWGIGVLFHALSVFGRFPAGWKQALIARELRRR
ncbi:UNVERIFIED_ORG: 2TM domain-containing protein [Herbaspirillum seropedicae]|jgi:hypothetical protein